MITAYQAVNLCVHSYDATNTVFDVWQTVNGVVGGIKYVGEDTVLVMRGSDDVEDWLRDLSAWPEWTADGVLDAGFADGMGGFIGVIKPAIKGNLIVTGHSLGAARCFIIAPRIKATQMILFGCPRVGLDDFKEAVVTSGVDIQSYRNGDDPVTLVPPYYEHVITPTQLRPAQSFDDPVQYHYIENYAASLPIS